MDKYNHDKSDSQLCLYTSHLRLNDVDDAHMTYLRLLVVEIKLGDK